MKKIGNIIFKYNSVSGNEKNGLVYYNINRECLVHHILQHISFSMPHCYTPRFVILRDHLDVNNVIVKNYHGSLKKQSTLTALASNNHNLQLNTLILGLSLNSLW